MRVFEIYDAAHRNRRACARLICSDSQGDIRIEISPDVGPDDLPMLLGLFAERGQLEVPAKWARRWVAERVPPQGRQNLGEVLRANGLREYNEIELLARAEGRSSQDDFMVREVSPQVQYAAVSLGDDKLGVAEVSSAGELQCKLGREIAERRVALGMTQRDLAEKTGIDQPAISRIESGRANPSIETLAALASGVGATLSIGLE